MPEKTEFSVFACGGVYLVSFVGDIRELLQVKCVPSSDIYWGSFYMYIATISL
jgi:hypothetical protein